MISTSRKDDNIFRGRMVYTYVPIPEKTKRKQHIIACNHCNQVIYQLGDYYHMEKNLENLRSSDEPFKSCHDHISTKCQKRSNDELNSIKKIEDEDLLRKLLCDHFRVVEKNRHKSFANKKDMKPQTMKKPSLTGIVKIFNFAHSSV